MIYIFFNDIFLIKVNGERLKNPAPLSRFPLVPLLWNLFLPRLCQHMKLARLKEKEKGVVKGVGGERATGGRGGAVVKLASDHLLSGILCRGQSSGASAWLRDWLRKGEMKTTVNF